jgi:hypothetical protein
MRILRDHIYSDTKVQILNSSRLPSEDYTATHYDICLFHPELMLAYRPTAESIIFRWQIIIGHRVEDDRTIGLCPLPQGKCCICVRKS